jgi:hypothetical protein
MKWKARTKQGAHSSDFLKLQSGDITPCISLIFTEYCYYRMDNLCSRMSLTLCDPSLPIISARSQNHLGAQKGAELDSVGKSPIQVVIMLTGKTPHIRLTGEETFLRITGVIQTFFL